MIYFRCPNCHKRGEAADQMAGVIVDCPDCRQRLRIPPPAASAPAQPKVAQPRDAGARNDGMVRFFCPYCTKKLKVPQEACGTSIHCKRCGQRIEVSAAPPAQPRAPASGDDPTLMTHLPDVLPEPPTQYYYCKHGVQYGPITALELRGLVDSGALQPTDWIWKKGLPRWKPAGKARGLFPAPQTPPPPPAAASALPAMPHPSAPAPSAATNSVSTPRTAAPASAPLPLPRTPAPGQAAVPLPTPRTPPPAVKPAPAPASLGTGFTEMIRVNPRDVLGYISRCFALAEKQEHDQALADLEAALHIDPHNTQALAARGVILAKAKGNYYRGLADLSSAIGFTPTDPILYELRAMLYREVADVDRAVADERKANALRS